MLPKTSLVSGDSSCHWLIVAARPDAAVISAKAMPRPPTTWRALTLQFIGVRPSSDRAGLSARTLAGGWRRGRMGTSSSVESQAPEDGPVEDGPMDGPVDGPVVEELTFRVEAELLEPWLARESA